MTSLTMPVFQRPLSTSSRFSPLNRLLLYALLIQVCSGAPYNDRDATLGNDKLGCKNSSLTKSPSSPEDRALREENVKTCQPQENYKLIPRQGEKRTVMKTRADLVANNFKEEVESYPENEINAILNSTSAAMRELFNVLNTPLDPNMNLTERTASFYNDDEVREESVCRSIIRNIYPREAKREESLVYVPNTQEFMQVIQVEICQSPNEECNFLQDNLPLGMQSICHQKYSYKKLLYLDPLEKRMASDLFRYPSCCSCHVRQTSIDLRSSLAVNNSTSPKQSRKNSPLNDELVKTTAQQLPSSPPPGEHLLGDLDINKEVTGLSMSFEFENKTFTSLKPVDISRRQAKSRNIDSPDELAARPLSRVDDLQKQEVALRSSSTSRPNKRNQQVTPRSTSIRPQVISARPAQVTGTTHSTVVLHADKVYTPNNDPDT